MDATFKSKRSPGRVGLRVGILSIFTAFLMVLGLAAYFAEGQAEIPMSLMPIPAMLFLIGILMIATDSLEKFLSIDDEAANLPRLLSDDWQALRHGRINRAIGMLVIVISLVAAEIYVLLTFKKWFATWGPFNVLGVAIIMCALAAVICFKSSWFQWRVDRTPWWIFCIPLIGFGLTMMSGIYFTEPIELGGQTRWDLSRDTYNWNQTRSSRIQVLNVSSGSSGGGGASFKLPECKGESCGTMWMGIILVALVAICVLGSIFVQHFWVAATLLMLTIMLMVVLRELLYHEEDHFYRGQDEPMHKQKW